jgi:hypothetical protein
VSSNTNMGASFASGCRWSVTHQVGDHEAIQ